MLFGSVFRNCSRQKLTWAGYLPAQVILGVIKFVTDNMGLFIAVVIGSDLDRLGQDQPLMIASKNLDRKSAIPGEDLPIADPHLVTFK
jgi:hypothetical protein